MSVFTQGNILQSFVVNNTKLAGAPTLPSATADLLTVMADSQIVAVGKPAGISTLYEQVIPGTNPAAGTYDYFRLVQKVLDPSGVAILNYGPIVKLLPTAVTSASTKTYVAPAEQVYYIGYNGTSGSLDVSQSNEFMLTIAYDHDDMMWSEQKLRNTYDYYSAAPTQQGLAMSMTSQINYKEQLGSLNGTGKMVVAEMLAQGTSGSLAGAATLAVTNGSTTITASAAQTWAVGTVIRIGTSGSGAAASDPVYVITGVTSTTVATIHMPFQGATNTAIPNGDIAILTGITNYGIRVTGQALTFQRDFFKYNKVKFHFDLKGFGTTGYDRPGSLTRTATPFASKESTKGNGSWQEASEYESFSMGNEGALNRMVIPIPPVRGYVVNGATYNVTSIAASDYTLTSPSSTIAGNSPMRIQQFIFFPTAGDGNTNKTQLNSQLSNLVGAI